MEIGLVFRRLNFSTMYVYRVETEYGDGPYVGCLSAKLKLSHNFCPTHPSAWALIKDLPNSHCGFYSFQQLKAWFKGFLTELEKEGYIVRKYRIRKKFVRKDKYQLVFVKEKSSFSITIPWSELNDSMKIGDKNLSIQFSKFQE